jgi:hypothetical protein
MAETYKTDPLIKLGPFIMPPRRKRKQNALVVLKLFRRDRFVIIDALSPATKKGFLAAQVL